MESPLKPLDPERLREERRTVDLGGDESEFNQVDREPVTGDQGRSAVDDATSGAVPPAR